MLYVGLPTSAEGRALLRISKSSSRAREMSRLDRASAANGRKCYETNDEGNGFLMPKRSLVALVVRVFLSAEPALGAGGSVSQGEPLVSSICGWSTPRLVRRVFRSHF